MKRVLDRKGVALVMALIISAVALAVMSTLLYMISLNTQMAGMTKRYSSALDAAEGSEGVITEALTQAIKVGQLKSTSVSTYMAAALSFNSTGISTNCGIIKITNSSMDSSWNNCDKSLIVNATSFDTVFTLGLYKVYAKIVDTIPGNSMPSAGDWAKNPVILAQTDYTVMSSPYFYTIEVNSINTMNTDERARVSILFEY